MGITQTRPGGRVVVPLRVSDYDDGTLVVLIVDADGQHASGEVVDDASFMPLRSQRSGGAASICDDDESAAAERTITDLHPWHLVGERGARFAIGQRVRDCYWRYRPDDDGRDALWLLDFVSGAWAKVEHPDKHAETFAVLQYGERRLFDEVERAWRWWNGNDRPGVERWRLTVGPDGSHFTLTD